VITGFNHLTFAVKELEPALRQSGLNCLALGGKFFEYLKVVPLEPSRTSGPDWWRFAKPLPPKRRKIALAKRAAWLREIDPSSLFHKLFDLLPGLHFFAKNSEGETMFSSRGILDLYGFSEETEIVGLTDFDLAPAQIAKPYVRDDARILRTGSPILNRVELWFDQTRMPDWYVVNKLPIRDHRGKITGIMGFLQSYEARAKLLRPFGGISKAVDHLRTHYSEKIRIDELARYACLSPRQVERRFKAAFGIGPHEFLIRTRILAACRSLRETDESLAETALACGFCDESAFVRQFHKHIGVTPGVFRRQLAGWK
jgi:AraC-like DNA-binding protein/PAS domain-containing protein